MAGHFDHNPIDLPCPKQCGHMFKETLARLERDPNRTCPSCGQDITFQVDGLRKDLDEFERKLRSGRFF